MNKKGVSPRHAFLLRIFLLQNEPSTRFYTFLHNFVCVENV